MRPSPKALRQNALVWLRQGISPRRLALSLALGCAVGCLPLVGIPTFICAGLALALGLNLPAIQAANYAVMPLQLLLIVPFMRLGGWLFSFRVHAAPAPSLFLHPAGALSLTTHLGSLALQAVLGWLLIAVPAVFLMTLFLTRLLHRIPALPQTESSN